MNSVGSTLKKIRSFMLHHQTSYGSIRTNIARCAASQSHSNAKLCPLKVAKVTNGCEKNTSKSEFCLHNDAEKSQPINFFLYDCMMKLISYVAAVERYFIWFITFNAIASVVYQSWRQSRQPVGGIWMRVFGIINSIWTQCDPKHREEIEKLTFSP